MTEAERARFDRLLEEVIESLPRRVRAVLEELPVIVVDRPSPALLDELGIPPEEHADAAEELCGLHTGVSLPDRSVDRSGDLPDDIHLFRVGIVNLAGGWESGDEAVREEIRITLLHEIGHHFGLDEDDLADLGYD
ncbi:MAG: metallopeptidase family protein [Leptolyngbya sp. PLA2]|nr:metallopeptidase family protein [Leptolyngbya sp. PL-A2]MCQ3941008.1 hypothetical protein [cyanobacterium CYA1]MCZ7633118.1 metallopeptidase family protein [Phycisphaerales bacterium]MDL1905601.1 metallopeptidase family protein [Synechococcales cyanobacterium CNB]GIK18824.1 MAG: Zn-dependent protease [Planctomycetota bacterium]